MARCVTEIAELLSAGDFMAVREDFDEAMASSLPSDGLRGAWEQVRALKGDFLGTVGDPIETSRDGYRVVDLPLHFERSDAKLRVSYASDGRVAGLFILNPEVP